MSKRGMTLLQFIVNLVIGIVCLIIIFTLFSAILNIFFFANEKQKAEATISRLAQYLQTTDEGQSINFLFYVPKGWWFVSISDGKYSAILNRALKPERIDAKCKVAKSNCICICRDGFGFWNGLDCLSGRNAYCEVTSRPFIKDGDLFAFKIQLEALTIIKKKEAYFVDKVTEYGNIKVNLDISVSKDFNELSPTEQDNFNKGYNNLITKTYNGKTYAEIIEEKSTENGFLTPNIAKAIAIKENVPMNPEAESKADSPAIGLMQIKVSTAQSPLGFKEATAELLKNPEYNLDVGTYYLAYMQNKYFGRGIDTPLELELIALGYHDGDGVILSCKKYTSPSTDCDRYTLYLSEAAKKESINYAPVVLAYYSRINEIEKNLPQTSGQNPGDENAA